MNSPRGAYALKARHVFPVDTPPIANGYVTIEDDRISAVSKAPPEGVRIIDLGNVALIPGLVNAHVHLEFSDLESPLGRPGMSLPDWIGLVLQYRNEQDLPPRIERITRGIQESLQYGTTALGEIATDDSMLYAEANLPMEVTEFRELIAPTEDHDRIEQCLSQAKQHLARQPLTPSWHPGLSPHAPYTVHQQLLKEAVALAVLHGISMAMHLAESPEEMQWLETGGGPFAELLRNRAASDESDNQSLKQDEPHLGPSNYIEALSTASKTLFAHGNYLDETSIRQMGEHAANMSVIYCPRTHTFFQHQDYPLDAMLTAGVNVALGTDGRSSNPNLSLLAEIRHVAEKHPETSPVTILRMGTLNGAIALGRESEFGSLAAGKLANLAVIDIHDEDSDSEDPHLLILESEKNNLATIHRGQVVYAARDYPSLSQAETQ